MTKIAYLLGAGASAGAVPVVNGMKDGAEELLHRLNVIPPDIFSEEGQDVQNAKVMIGELIEICARSSSVDTYGKILHDSRQIHEFELLKERLILYFSLTEALKGTDRRYENFIAGVSSMGVMSSNISIFSWNYDLQLESSMGRFVLSERIGEIRKRLGFMDATDFTNGPSDGFSFVKLNGSACFRTLSGNAHATPLVLKGDNTEQRLKDVCTNYRKLRDAKKDMCLRFAWEQPTRDMLIGFLTRLRPVNVLVIIGYSFPSFNRYIDKLILSNLNPQKVILQYPEPTGARIFIEEVLGGNKKLKIQEDVDTSQFHIPFEFNPI